MRPGSSYARRSTQSTLAASAVFKKSWLNMSPPLVDLRPTTLDPPPPEPPPFRSAVLLGRLILSAGPTRSSCKHDCRQPIHAAALRRRVRVSILPVSGRQRRRSVGRMALGQGRKDQLSRGPAQPSWTALTSSNRTAINGCPSSRLISSFRPRVGWWHDPERGRTGRGPQRGPCPSNRRALGFVLAQNATSHRIHGDTEREAHLDLFRWLHRYITVRRHSRLGHHSPIAYERALRTTSTTLAEAA